MKTRSSKRILSLVLALIMALSLVPATAVTALAVEKTPITSIALNGSGLAAGATSNVTVTVPNGATYCIPYPDYSCYFRTINDSSFDTLKAGYVYLMYARVQVNSGYKFLSKSDFQTPETGDMGKKVYSNITLTVGGKTYYAIDYQPYSSGTSDYISEATVCFEVQIPGDYVGNLDFTGTSQDITTYATEQGGVRWDSATSTLYLNNATIAGFKYNSDGTAAEPALKLPAGANIVFSGTDNHIINACYSAGEYASYNSCTGYAIQFSGTATKAGTISGAALGDKLTLSAYYTVSGSYSFAANLLQTSQEQASGIPMDAIYTVVSTHQVSTEDCRCGKLNVRTSNPVATGEMVVVVATPFAGCSIDYVRYRYTLGGQLYEKPLKQYYSEGQYYFYMPDADVTVYASFCDADEDALDLWVEGERVTRENASNITGNAGTPQVVYDEATDTITLTDYTYSGSSPDGVIVSENDLNLVLNGTNTINNEGGVYGIRVGGTDRTSEDNEPAKVRISGGGTLNVNVNITQDSFDTNGHSAAALYVASELVIDDVQVSLAVTHDEGIVSTGSYSQDNIYEDLHALNIGYGLHVNSGKLTLSSDGELILAEDYRAYSYTGLNCAPVYELTYGDGGFLSVTQNIYTGENGIYEVCTTDHIDGLIRPWMVTYMTSAHTWGTNGNKCMSASIWAPGDDSLILHEVSGPTRTQDIHTYTPGDALPTPTRDGATFAGWYDNEDLTGTPVTAVPSDATGCKEYWAKWANAEGYGLKVGGAEVTNENLSGTGWSFNAATNTLTLNNLSFTDDGTNSDLLLTEKVWDGDYNTYKNARSYIYYYGAAPLTIEVQGENTISCIDTNSGNVRGMSFLFDANTDVTFTGSGTLTTRGIYLSNRAKMVVNGPAINTVEVGLSGRAYQNYYSYLNGLGGREFSTVKVVSGSLDNGQKITMNGLCMEVDGTGVATITDIVAYNVTVNGGTLNIDETWSLTLGGNLFVNGGTLNSNAGIAIGEAVVITGGTVNLVGEDGDWPYLSSRQWIQTGGTYNLTCDYDDDCRLFPSGQYVFLSGDAQVNSTCTSDSGWSTPTAYDMGSNLLIYDDASVILRGTNSGKAISTDGGGYHFITREINEASPTKVYTNAEMENQSWVRLTAGPEHAHNDCEFTNSGVDFSATLDEGSYYLTQNVTLTQDLIVAANTSVNICLNGYELDLNGYNIRNNGTLSICDCKNTKHFFTVDNTTGLWSASATSTTNYVRGGVITGGTEGAILNAEGATLNIKGGYIVGNSNTGNGGAIVNNGTLNFTGGSVIGNTSGGKGGGIYLAENSTFNLSGGTVKKNVSTGDGGGIMTETGVTFTLTGSVTIRDNRKGSDKNNLYITPEVLLDGSNLDSSSYIGVCATDTIPQQISEPKQQTYSSWEYNSQTGNYEEVPGVTPLNPDCFVVDDASLCVNQTYASGKYTLYIQDRVTAQPEATNGYTFGINTMNYFGTVSYQWYQKEGDVLLDGQTSASLNTAGASLGDAYYCKATFKDYDDNVEKVVQSDDAVYSHYHSATKETFEQPIPTSGALTSGTYALNGDTTLEGNLTVATGTDVKICITGYTLNMNGFHFIVEEGGSLNICDCGTEEHHFTVGATGLWTPTNDDATVSYTALTEDPEAGDVVSVTGGVITGGSSATEEAKGGAVKVDAGGSFTFRSGAIIGNSLTGSSSKGGAVYNEGTTAVIGGIIAGNTAQNGAGVYNACETAGGVVLGGSAKLAYNTAADRGDDLITKQTVTVATGSSAPAGMSVGVLLVNSLTLHQTEEGTFATGVTAAQKAYFFPENDTTQRIDFATDHLTMKTVKPVEFIENSELEIGKATVGGEEEDASDLASVVNILNNVDNATDYNFDIESKLSGAKQIQVKVKTASVSAETTEADNAVITRATFDVSPKDIKGNTVDGTAVDVTFRLPVLDTSKAYKSATVMQGDKIISASAIQGAVGNQYVEVTVDEFSGGEFSYELIPVDLGAVDNTHFSASLELLQNINMNFYVSINGAQNDEEAAKYTVEYTFNGEEKSHTLTASDYVSGKTSYRVVVAEAFSYQMTLPVAINVYYEETLIKSVDVSVVSYCSKAMTQYSTNAELVSLCQAILDYGASAQETFEGNFYNVYVGTVKTKVPYVIDPVPANKDITTHPYLALTDADRPTTSKSTYSNKNKDTLSGFKTSMVLGNEIAVKFYFKCTEDIANYTLTYKVGDADAVACTATPETGSTDTYTVKVDGLKPVDLDKKVTLIITKTEGGTVTKVNYSGYAFANSYWEYDEEKDDLRLISRTLVAYCQRAQAYFNTLQQ